MIRLRRTNTPAVPIANRIAATAARYHIERERVHANFLCRRASTTAPTIATRIRIEVTSNGNA